ncbi:oligopeptide ABC transporter permease [Actinobacillus equuli]|nr:oligopeptide ABC transporter permease [Actinobacillus equuli]
MQIDKNQNFSENLASVNTAMVLEGRSLWQDARRRFFVIKRQLPAYLCCC